jgi:hypothetical protein
VARRTKVKIALALISLAVLYCLYWLCFSIWMSAYPLADSKAWTIRIYWLFSLCVVLAIAWMYCVIWLIKRKGLEVEDRWFGECESCHSNFEYLLIHNGFSDTAYAYCDTCGTTCLVGGWDDKRKPREAPLKIQGPIQAETEPWLQSCPCGGRFRAKSSPRCPTCRHVLSAELATSYIEKNAPGTKGGWRWQKDWNGIYCIVIAGRLIKNNWMTQA